MVLHCVCFFKQKTADEVRISDWSSDVCSSDLGAGKSLRPQRGEPAFAGHHIKTGPPGFARAQVTVRLWMMPRASIEAARPSRRMPPVLRTLSGDGNSWWSGIARTSDGTWTCAFIMCLLLVVIGAFPVPPPPGAGGRKSTRLN